MDGMDDTGRNMEPFGPFCRLCHLIISVLVLWVKNLKSNIKNLKSKMVIMTDTFSPPEWACRAVWYQIFPERFCNGDPSNDPTADSLEIPSIHNWECSSWTEDWYKLAAWEREVGGFKKSVWHRRYGGDIQGILNKLDYLQELGVNALYLNPVFAARSCHKYDSICLHHIDPHFGSDPQGDRTLIEQAGETEDPATWVWTAADRLFISLVREVHSRGMHIIIDGVFNHCGRDFFAFRDVLVHGRESRYAGWFIIKKWTRRCADGFTYKGWAGVRNMPEFARNSDTLVEPVRNYIFACTSRWMKPSIDNEGNAGIDGWRLDVAECVPRGFWRDWCRYVKTVNPRAYITGEIVQVGPEYTDGSMFDALMNYPFLYCLSEVFVDRKHKINMSEFDKRLAYVRDAYKPENTQVMQNLLDSHDTNRIASALVNPDRYYRRWGKYNDSSRILHNRRYVLRNANREEKKRLKLMILFQMAYIGAPMIYYGDEAGMWGANDPCNRKPMLWNELSYTDECADVHHRKRKPEENRFDAELFEYYRKCIRIRKEHPVFTFGSYKTLWLDDDQKVFVFARQYEAVQAVIIINAGEKKQDVEWRDEWPAGNRQSLMTGIPCNERVLALEPVSADIFLVPG
jgi:glycosidase